MKKKHSQSRDLFLEKAYYTANKPGSFGGINRFKSLLKSKKKNTQQPLFPNGYNHKMHTHFTNLLQKNFVAE